MRNSIFSGRLALLIGAVALVSATVACSRGELSAAEREKSARETARPPVLTAAVATPVSSDSSALFDVTQGQMQTKSPSSIEDILRASPLKSAKADCSTPVSGVSKPTDIGTQCPTDPPAKR